MLAIPGVAVLVAALVLALAGPAVGAVVTDEAVQALASQLRCVVCQNLSVADSPSEMARQMRDVIRERLGQGETPDQVRTYFVDRYGEWVLLTPPPHGFNLLLWILPFAGLLGGLALVLVRVRRWSRRSAVPGPIPEAALRPEERERIRGELDRLRD